jgi:hypothetical protein
LPLSRLVCGNEQRRILLSLTALALAACSGSSGGTASDAGPGGVTGAGGSGGGAGSGSPAADASASGGGGGTPSPCPDPAFPRECPALGGVPSLCWSAGTDCSTIAKCGDQFRSCTSANAHYDCAEMRCVVSGGGDGGLECGDPAFPVSCPATSEVPQLCWSAGTACSTISRCGSDFKSCLAPGFHFSCADQRCVPDTGSPADAAPSAPDAAAPDAATDASTLDALPADLRPVDSD